jgi:hypothetical protein
MKKRFVLALDESTKEQNKAFLNEIKSKQLSWWHWLTNTWLLVDNTGTIKASDLRDIAQKHFPNIDKIVLELRSDGSTTWSGFGEKGPNKNMFTWLHKNWQDASKP